MIPTWRVLQARAGECRRAHPTPDLFAIARGVPTATHHTWRFSSEADAVRLCGLKARGRCPAPGILGV